MKKILLVFLLTISPSVADAYIFNGLDWLPFTRTLGRSYNDISSQLGIGGEFEGYRFAHGNDVLPLFSHFGFTELNVASPLYYNNAQNFINTFGATESSPGYAQAKGIVEPGLLHPTSGQPIHLAYGVALLDGSNPTGGAFTNISGSLNSYATPTLASFLVKDVNTAAVPEPTTLVMVGLGSIGLLYRKRKINP